MCFSPSLFITVTSACSDIQVIGPFTHENITKKRYTEIRKDR
jgi:hypothetical protein